MDAPTRKELLRILRTEPEVREALRQQIHEIAHARYKKPQGPSIEAVIEGRVPRPKDWPELIVVDAREGLMFV